MFAVHNFSPDFSNGICLEAWVRMFGVSSVLPMVRVSGLFGFCKILHILQNDEVNCKI